MDVTSFVVVALYLAVIGYFSWRGFRQTRTAADYLLAGRSAHPVVMALSYGATFISTAAIVGFGGISAQFGMGLLWLTFLNIFVGVFIAFVFLGGPTRKMGHHLDAHTFPELLGRRYASRFVQVFAGLVIFAFMPLYAMAAINGASEFIVRAFGINFEAALYVFAAVVAVYVLFGGLKGVMATEALQGGIMLFGMLVLLGVTYFALGGVTPAHEALSDLEASPNLQAIGHRGYTSMPDFGWAAPAAENPAAHHLWWIMISGITLGVGIGVLAQPQLVVRFMTVPSKKSLNRAVAPGAFFIFAVIGTVYVVGPLSNVFFRHEEVIPCTVVDEDVIGYAGEQDGKVVVKRVPEGEGPPEGARTFHLIAYVLPGQEAGAEPSHVLVTEGTTWGKNPGGETPHLLRPGLQSMERTVTFGRSPGGNADEVIPTYVTSAMPRWFGLLFLLTLLSAGMSTVASQFHTIGVSIGRDVFEQFSHKHSQRSVLVARLGIGVGIIVAIVLGQVLRGNIVAAATAMFFGLCGATFLPAFIGGLFWKRMTRAGAISSMLVGFCSSMLWLAFMNQKVGSALGICEWFTGAPNLARKFSWLSLTWEVVDPLVVALPLSAAAAVIVSLLTRPLDPDHVAWCFGGPRKGPIADKLEEAQTKPPEVL